MAENHFIHLRSSKFAILPGEKEELVNDGTYGKSLALYLQSALASRGVLAPQVVCEDWGWWVEIGGLSFSCGLCIYGRPTGESDALELCVTVGTPQGRRWSWSRFRVVDTTEAIQRLLDQVHDILDGDPDVTVLGITFEFPL